MFCLIFAVGIGETTQTQTFIACVCVELQRRISRGSQLAEEKEKKALAHAVKEATWPEQQITTTITTTTDKMQ